MSHIEILLPFALPAPAIAQDVLRALDAPALSSLLARAKAAKPQRFDPFARALPHEKWLAAQSGSNSPAEIDSDPGAAMNRMSALQLEQQEGFWFVLQPVHIHVARDHLVLTDRRRSRLAEEEARILFASALPLFREAGKEALYGSADYWFVRADDWRNLQTATPDAACGHNIDIWMPKGDGERAWRKLQNEVQMEWHEHAVNLAREESRQPPVNSLWLWGGADAGAKTVAQPEVLTEVTTTANDLLSAARDTQLVVLDSLSEAALAEDWSAWLDTMHALERNWFAPMLQGLQTGKLSRLSLIACHNTEMRAFHVTRHSLYKFWIKPSLDRLLP